MRHERIAGLQPAGITRCVESPPVRGAASDVETQYILIVSIALDKPCRKMLVAGGRTDDLARGIGFGDLKVGKTFAPGRGLEIGSHRAGDTRDPHNGLGILVP